MDHQRLFQAPDPAQAVRAPRPSARPDTTRSRPARAPKAGWLEKRGERWRAHITLDGRRQSKTFTDPDEAVGWLDTMSEA
jgi:hypothetical protein